MFSLQPDDHKGLKKDYYCNDKCEVIGKLKGENVERRNKKLY